MASQYLEKYQRDQAKRRNSLKEKMQERKGLKEGAASEKIKRTYTPELTSEQSMNVVWRDANVADYCEHKCEICTEEATCNKRRKL